MLTVLLPPETAESDIEEIMGQAAETAEKLGVEIIGGHTEITDAVTKPVITSTAVGRGKAGRASGGERMKPGDRILVSKKLAMEGTGIIASDHGEELAGVLTKDELRRASAMLDEVSVVREGVLAGAIGTTGMHDITEGGVLGAVWEMCRLSETGAEIWKDALPVDAVTRKVCEHFGLDPFRLISSGAMLMIARPAESVRITEVLRAEGIEVTEIGILREKTAGICLRGEADTETIAPPDSDEIYKMITD
jgi:hydrogenase expression/formation protein HypE